MNDEDILEGLKELDCSDITVTRWEADFLDSMFKKNPNAPRFSNPQREKAIEILEGHGYETSRAP